MTALRLLLGGAFALLAALTPVDASAHTQSYGFLTVSVADDAVDGHVDLAVRDLDTAYNLDADGDGKVLWGEFRAREDEIGSAVLDRISIGDPGNRCALKSQPAGIDSRGGETYLVIPFRGDCPSLGGSLEIGYGLMFDVDAQHRGLVSVTSGGGTQSFVMTPGAASVSVDARTAGAAALFVTFVWHGAHHIWIGYDHILFIITLLLGAVVARQAGAWVPVESLRSALVAITKVVTAFTLAHSLTLGLAALDIMRLPVPLVESAIAATITLAAINNIVPLVTRKLWLVAFVFGLVHGFGFANVLADLDLPRQGLVTALFAFNVGVELGQLAIVLAVLPLLVLASRQASYGRVALPVASLVIAAIGAMWFVERAMGISILSSG